MSRQELVTSTAPNHGEFDGLRICRYAAACEPPFWARGGHLQTLFSHLLPSPGFRFARGGDFEEREIELCDGERLLAFEIPGSSGVRVHLFHGLSGDVNSEYMRRTAAVLAEQGHEVWCVNHRGCGEGKGLATRPYHSGKTEDLEAVLARSRAEAPDRLCLVIGFSLSGNLALLHSAQGREPRPDGIIAVNPPVDLLRATEDVHRGGCRVYELRFIRRLRQGVDERERIQGKLPRTVIPRTASLREFDDLYTAPTCGFSDALDYYRRCSSVQRLSEVETPSVILTAADDPFVDPSALDGISLSPQVFLHLERTGGHVGYLARRGLAGWRRWLDGALSHYVAELASKIGSR